jgi:hypothetical protein
VGVHEHTQAFLCFIERGLLAMEHYQRRSISGSTAFDASCYRMHFWGS